MLRLPTLQFLYFLYPAWNEELAAALGIHQDVLGNLLNPNNWIELLVLQMGQIKRLSSATQNDMRRRFGLVVTEEGKGNDWNRTTSVVLNAAAFPNVMQELARLGPNEAPLSIFSSHGHYSPRSPRSVRCHKHCRAIDRGGSPSPMER